MKPQTYVVSFRSGQAWPETPQGYHTYPVIPEPIWFRFVNYKIPLEEFSTSEGKFVIAKVEDQYLQPIGEDPLGTYLLCDERLSFANMHATLKACNGSLHWVKNLGFFQDTWEKTLCQRAEPLALGPEAVMTRVKDPSDGTGSYPWLYHGKSWVCPPVNNEVSNDADWMFQDREVHASKLDDMEIVEEIMSSSTLSSLCEDITHHINMWEERDRAVALHDNREHTLGAPQKKSGVSCHGYRGRYDPACFAPGYSGKNWVLSDDPGWTNPGSGRQTYQKMVNTLIDQAKDPWRVPLSLSRHRGEGNRCVIVYHGEEGKGILTFPIIVYGPNGSGRGLSSGRLYDKGTQSFIKLLPPPGGGRHQVIDLGRRCQI